MASKNAHHSEVSDQLLTDLGFDEAVEVGLMMKNLNIEENLDFAGYNYVEEEVDLTL